LSGAILSEEKSADLDAIERFANDNQAAASIAGIVGP
jgi:hypothetical protein